MSKSIPSRQSDLLDEGLDHGPVDLQLLGLHAEHPVELEGLGVVVVGALEQELLVAGGVYDGVGPSRLLRAVDRPHAGEHLDVLAWAAMGGDRLIRKERLFNRFLIRKLRNQRHKP